MAETNPQGVAVRIRSGARLHFGLFDTQPPFGGLGMMVDQPTTELLLRPATTFDPGTVDSERIREIARRFACPPQATCPPLPACAIRVRRQPAVHSGLGSGTQLALAVAAGLARLYAVERSVDQLIQHIAARGKRSAVGSLGFFHGGLIAETGAALPYSDRSWWTRHTVPETWRALLIRPAKPSPAVSGERESQAFASLPPADPITKRTLTRLGKEIQAAVATADFPAFAAALTQFNRLSGELFAAAQGGCYNGVQVSETIDAVQAAGATAYGQSSWGPTVFVICPDPTAAESLAARLPQPLTVQIARPLATAAEITVGPLADSSSKPWEPSHAPGG